jgi:hypothetical protein
MIPLWKGKNPIYVGVIRSKVKVTVTMNIIFLWCLTPLSTIYLDLQLPMQSVPITTDVVGSKTRSGRGVQQYVIKFVSDLRQVGGFL